MPNWNVLYNEVINDPQVRGYAGMTNLQVTTSLNTLDCDEWLLLDAGTLYEAFDRTELNNLDAAGNTKVDRVLSLQHNIDIGPGTTARGELLDVFGGASQTAANLLAVAHRFRSRGQEIGWGTVTESQVAKVRSI